MAGQAGHQHIEQLSVDKRQRIAQILGIWIEPQLLSLFGRGKCHIGLASQQLRQVAAGRVGADGIIGQRIHLEAIGAGDISCLFARARSTRRTRRHFVRRDTGDELVDRTRRCIDIDRRRHAKHAQVGDIVGEHLGRGVGHRRAAQRGIALGKRRLAAGAGHRRGGLERQRRAKVDQAQVEGAFGKLSVERQARRAHHYISGRDITMDEPLAYQAHAAEQIEQVATQARRHERRQTPGIIYGKARAQAGERLALDPLHDNRGHAVDLAPPV